MKKEYRELSEEEKDIKRKYSKNRYHNMSEERKQKPKEYQKNYTECKQPKYWDVISSILPSETFNFLNMISSIFNSSSISLT